MELNEFIQNFAELFEDTDTSEITASCAFHDLDEWSSIVGLSTIALAKIRYGKTISGSELKKCITVEDIFNLIND